MTQSEEREAEKECLERSAGESESGECRAEKECLERSAGDNR
jgi:hypothetical protein